MLDLSLVSCCIAPDDDDEDRAFAVNIDEIKKKESYRKADVQLTVNLRLSHIWILVDTLQMQQRLFELSARCDGKFKFGTLYSVDSRI